MLSIIIKNKWACFILLPWMPKWLLVATQQMEGAIADIHGIYIYTINKQYLCTLKALTSEISSALRIAMRDRLCIVYYFTRPLP